MAALSQPARRQIVELLAARGPLPAGDIASGFAMTAPAVSQHLKALREAGLVRMRPQGQQRIYSLDPEALNHLAEWFTTLRARVSALGRLVEDQKDH